MTTKKFCDFHGCNKEITGFTIHITVEEIIGVSTYVVSHRGLPYEFDFCEEHWKSILGFIGE